MEKLSCGVGDGCWVESDLIVSQSQNLSYLWSQSISKFISILNVRPMDLDFWAWQFVKTHIGKLVYFDCISEGSSWSSSARESSHCSSSGDGTVHMENNSGLRQVLEMQLKTQIKLIWNNFVKFAFSEKRNILFIGKKTLLSLFV